MNHHQPSQSKIGCVGLTRAVSKTRRVSRPLCHLVGAHAALTLAISLGWAAASHGQPAPIRGSLSDYLNSIGQDGNHSKNAFISPSASEAAQSAIVLRREVAKLNAMPPTKASLARLSVLFIHYSLPGLTTNDQNRFRNAVADRSGAISLLLERQRCAPVIAQIPIPSEVRTSQIYTSAETESVDRFLCAAKVATGRASIRAAWFKGPGAYVVDVGNLELLLRLGHYDQRHGAFFPLASGIQRGALTLWPETAKGPAGTQPINGSDMVNIFAQFGPAYGSFVDQ